MAEKYANEAETVAVFYFSFISPCAMGLSVKSKRDASTSKRENDFWIFVQVIGNENVTKSQAVARIADRTASQQTV